MLGFPAFGVEEGVAVVKVNEVEFGLLFRRPIAAEGKRLKDKRVGDFGHVSAWKFTVRIKRRIHQGIVHGL